MTFKRTGYGFFWTGYGCSDNMGGSPSHIPAHTSPAAAAPFQA